MNINWDDLELLEEMKDGYEPETEEIIEYAKYLGLIFPQDQRYLPIVKQGLIASLPPFWEACEASNGELYFRNRRTRHITQDNPLDEIYRQKIKEMKRIEGTYGVEPINEESLLRQSSGIMKSSSLGRKSQLMKLSSKYPRNELNLGESLIEHHITEESVYSEDDSPKETLGKDRRDELRVEGSGLTKKQKERMSRMKHQIDGFFPQSWQLITSQESLPLDIEQLAQYMNIDHLKQLIAMKANVEKKKAEIERVRESNKALKEAYIKLQK